MKNIPDIPKTKKELDEFKKKSDLHNQMRDEFDSFVKKWIKKYKFSHLVYLSIIFNMSNFVALRDEKGCLEDE